MGGSSLAAHARADATTDAAALKQFDAGRAAFERGELATALAAFEASMEALPSPNTRLYVARCQRGLGKVGSAFTSYRRAAREAADRLSATGEKRFTATRDTAQAEAAELERRVPHLEVALPADAPTTTSVRLDDVELPRTALTSLDLDPGSHVLRVAAPRRSTFEQRFELAEGKKQTIEVSLPRLPTAILDIALTAKPAGVVFALDGRSVEPAVALAKQELDVGPHRIVVRAPGYRDFAWSGALADGEERRVVVVLEANAAKTTSRGTPPWLFFGVAAASVVALGVGTYFAIDATNRASNEKEKDPLVRSPSEQDQVRSASTTANVLFIAGAAVAGGAGALFFITDWNRGASVPAKKSGRIGPWITWAGAGASGSF